MTGVALLSQLNAQLSRFETLNTQFASLQRGLTTGKKTTTYDGLGDDALSTLRYRTNISESSKYMQNIDVATTRIKSMDNSLNLIQKQVKTLQSGILQQPLDGEIDITTLKAYSAKLLEVMPGNLNEEIDGRFIFSGSDVTAKPYDGNEKLAGIVQKDVSDWLDGTITTDAFLSKIENYTDDEVGFTPEVLSAGEIKVNADENYTLNYTVKASDASIKNILVVSEVFKQLQNPGETDAPTADDMKDVIIALGKKLDNGAKGLEDNIVTLQAGMATLNDVKSAHKYDNETMQTLIEGVENIDPTEAAVKLQNIKLQLEASYQVAASTASMNLLNFID